MALSSSISMLLTSNLRSDVVACFSTARVSFGITFPKAGRFGNVPLILAFLEQFEYLGEHVIEGHREVTLPAVRAFP